MTIEEQIAHFCKGFPWLEIEAPATPSKGILVLSKCEEERAIRYYDTASINGKCKFVPASGAASRMFKDLFNGLDSVSSGKDITGTPAGKFCDNIERFAFWDRALFGDASQEEILLKTLTKAGLEYGAKPKGVLKFHKYPDGEIRTAIAEHLVEAQDYMRNDDGTANLTVTISPEHRPLFENALEDILPEFEKRYGVKYNVRFTFQDKATDTIAVDMDNRPFLADDGSQLFRPAGHGALIYNLNDVEEELVSIKNIDNVACERLLPVTSRYKKILIGKALELRDVIFGFLRNADAWTSEDCDEIEKFLENTLCIRMPQSCCSEARKAALRAKLDRPVRVCGMVRNEGEPGGGPFIILEKDGSTSLQILEGAQIDGSNPKSKAALEASTHFNPVDLVCCLHRYDGTKFDLTKFVDSETGFISYKSSQGRELKALELPGLWNGAMSRWNTLFVEVPLETFNPVKTVLDLLRPAHIA